MEIIRDNATIAEIKEKYPTDRFFSPEFQNYHYRRYRKNEYIQTPDRSMNYYYIILSGSVQLFALSAEGDRTPIASLGELDCIGNVEICYFCSPAYALAGKETICLTIPMEACREQLMDDLNFLKYNVQTYAKLLTFVSFINFSGGGMNDRLLYYLSEQKDHMITNVEATTFALRCSRSSLQRALVQMVADGEIEKVGKGTYRLVKDPNR